VISGRADNSELSYITGELLTRHAKVKKASICLEPPEIVQQRYALVKVQLGIFLAGGYFEMAVAHSLHQGRRGVTGAYH